MDEEDVGVMKRRYKIILYQSMRVNRLGKCRNAGGH